MSRLTRMVGTGVAIIMAAGSLAGCAAGYENTVGETADNLPKVEGKFNESATVDVTEGKAPTTLQSVVVTEGKGDEIAEGDTIDIKYQMTQWGQTKPIKGHDNFESKKSEQYKLDSTVIAGWQKGLVGKHEGDRVLIVAPPDTAYGEHGSPPDVPAQATLVFVIDILKVTK